MVSISRRTSVRNRLSAAERKRQEMEQLENERRKYGLGQSFNPSKTDQRFADIYAQDGKIIGEESSGRKFNIGRLDVRTGIQGKLSREEKMAQMNKAYSQDFKSTPQRLAEENEAKLNKLIAEATAKEDWEEVAALEATRKSGALSTLKRSAAGLPQPGERSAQDKLARFRFMTGQSGAIAPQFSFAEGQKPQGEQLRQMVRENLAEKRAKGEAKQFKFEEQDVRQFMEEGGISDDVLSRGTQRFFDTVQKQRQQLGAEGRESLISGAEFNESDQKFSQLVTSERPQPIMDENGNITGFEGTTGDPVLDKLFQQKIRQHHAGQDRNFTAIDMQIRDRINSLFLQLGGVAADFVNQQVSLRPKRERILVDKDQGLGLGSSDREEIDLRDQEQREMRESLEQRKTELEQEIAQGGTFQDGVLQGDTTQLQAELDQVNAQIGQLDVTQPEQTTQPSPEDITQTTQEESQQPEAPSEAISGTRPTSTTGEELKANAGLSEAFEKAVPEKTRSTYNTAIDKMAKAEDIEDLDFTARMLEEAEVKAQEAEAEVARLQQREFIMKRDQADREKRRREDELERQRQTQLRDIRRQRDKKVNDAKAQLAAQGRLTTDSEGNLDNDAIALLQKIENDADSVMNDSISTVENNYRTQRNAILDNYDQITFGAQDAYFGAMQAQQQAAADRQQGIIDMINAKYLEQEFAKGKTGSATKLVQEYNQAVATGFEGGYMDFLKQLQAIEDGQVGAQPEFKTVAKGATAYVFNPETGEYEMIQGGGSGAGSSSSFGIGTSGSDLLMEYAQRFQRSGRDPNVLKEAAKVGLSEAAIIEKTRSLDVPSGRLYYTGSNDLANPTTSGLMNDATYVERQPVVIDKIENIMSFINSNRDNIGSGFFNELAADIDAKGFGEGVTYFVGKTTPQEKELLSRFNEMLAAYVKSISGAAVSAKEFARLRSVMPNLAQDPDENLMRLELLRQGTIGEVQSVLKNRGLSIGGHRYFDFTGNPNPIMDFEPATFTESQLTQDLTDIGL